MARARRHTQTATLLLLSLLAIAQAADAALGLRSTGARSAVEGQWQRRGRALRAATAQQGHATVKSSSQSSQSSSSSAELPLLDPGHASSGPEVAKEQVQRIIWAMSQAERAGSVWAALTNFSQQASATNAMPAGAAVGAAPLGTPGPQQRSAASGNMMRLVNCVNRAWVPKNQTWETAMRDDLASVRVAGAWWTAKQRRVPLTVVTQSTVDRIPQLFAQCKSWGGPTSLVLYRALVEDAVRPDHKLTPKNEEILRYDILQVRAAGAG